MIENIGDHMARVCDCGCVKFNLLKSGAIECAGCQQKQPKLFWSAENMNIELTELDAMATALSLLRRIYIESEINEEAVVYITNERFPRLYNEITREIGKLERVLASSLKAS